MQVIYHIFTFIAIRDRKDAALVDKLWSAVAQMHTQESWRERDIPYNEAVVQALNFLLTDNLYKAPLRFIRILSFDLTSAVQLPTAPPADRVQYYRDNMENTKQFITCCRGVLETCAQATPLALTHLTVKLKYFPNNTLPSTGLTKHFSDMNQHIFMIGKTVKMLTLSGLDVTIIGEGFTQLLGSYQPCIGQITKLVNKYASLWDLVPSIGYDKLHIAHCTRPTSQREGLFQFLEGIEFVAQLRRCQR